MTLITLKYFRHTMLLSVACIGGLLMSSCGRQARLTDDNYAYGDHDDNEFDLPLPKTSDVDKIESNEDANAEKHQPKKDKDSSGSDSLSADATSGASPSKPTNPGTGTNTTGGANDWSAWLEKLASGIGGAIGGDPVGQATTCVDGDSFICAVEAAVVRLCNAARVKNGVGEYKQNFEVSFVSRDWSQQQASTGGISHAGFPAQRVAVFNKRFPGQKSPGMSGENVAKGMAWNKTDPEVLANSLVNMWLNSPGHRANIMGMYRAIGVGVACSGPYTCVGTQIFIR